LHISDLFPDVDFLTSNSVLLSVLRHHWASSNWKISLLQSQKGFRW